MRRLTATVMVAIFALGAVLPGVASAKTYRKSLKPQPSREYRESPKFRAKVVLKAGRTSTLTVNATKIAAGDTWVDLRKAKRGRQPCSPDGTKAVGPGKNNRASKLGGKLTATGKAGSKVGKGKATFKARVNPRSGVWYASIRKTKRAKETYMCAVVVGHAKK